MIIKTLADLDALDWYIGGVSAICQSPEYSFLSHKGSGRMVNGFLYIVSGCIECSFGEDSFILSENSLAYLPEGSMHTITLAKNTVFKRIDFTIIDGESANRIVFSDSPILLYEQTPKHIEDRIDRLCNAFSSHKTGYVSKCISYVSWLISEISSDMSVGEKSILNIAVNYINENMTADFTIEYLAEMCNVSSAHFRRLFKAQFGMTPIKYKNNLRISKAKMLLRRSSLSICEIASFLGFDSEYYFSRVFKDITGTSPGAYKKTKKSV